MPESLGITGDSVSNVPLALVILGTFLLGFLVGELVEFTRERKYRAQLGAKRRELAAAARGERAPRPQGRRQGRRSGADPALTAPVRVKICGLTRPEAVRQAADAGAAYVGIVLFPPSPRNVAPPRRPRR